MSTQETVENLVRELTIDLALAQGKLEGVLLLSARLQANEAVHVQNHFYAGTSPATAEASCT